MVLFLKYARVSVHRCIHWLNTSALTQDANSPENDKLTATDLSIYLAVTSLLLVCVVGD